MMEQEDVSELPGGPTEVSNPAPMVLDEEEQHVSAGGSCQAHAAMHHNPLVATEARRGVVSHNRAITSLGGLLALRISAREFRLIFKK